MPVKTSAAPPAVNGKSSGQGSTQGTVTEQYRQGRRSQAGRPSALSLHQVSAARQLRRDGLSITQIALVFGVSRSVVWRSVHDV